MFGPKDIKGVWDSVAGFGFTFEVVEDPVDDSRFKDTPKAVAVWLLALKSNDDAQIGALDFAGLLKRDLIFVASITRETPVESRRWAKSTLEKVWLSVIAAPTAEWAQFYEHRAYPAVPIIPGYRGNFTVSLRPRTHAAPALSPIVSVPPRGFNP